MDFQKLKLERRKYIRINKPYIISFYAKEDPEKNYDITKIKDISLGGLSFLSPKDYKNGTSICIKSQTSLQDEPFYLEGKVVESHEKVPDLLYEQHINFHKPSPQAGLVLNKIISQRTNKS